MLSGNLIYLVIAGEPDIKLLLKAWDAITEEYSGLINNGKADNVFSVYKNLEKTRYKIFYISTALDYLKHDYDHEIAESLAEMGYFFIKDMPDRKDYLGQIFRVETQAKFLIVLLNQYTNEYNILNKGKEGSAIMRTVMDYEREIMILSKHQGYGIRKERTTLIEYCAIVNNYIDYHKKVTDSNGS